MNKLQIDYISPNRVSGSEGKKHVVDHEHWEDFPDFNHEPISFKKVMTEAISPMITLFIWLIIIILMTRLTAKKARAI